MSGQVTITQLPVAGALTGTEGVPIVQNGVTVQTTTGAIAGAGALNYPFLTVGSTAGLTQARYIATGSGLTVTDNGAGNSLQINLIGAALSLDNAGTGIIVKTGSTTVTNRLLTVGAGMTIANADAIAGNPLIGLNTNLQNLASLSGTGILAINGSTFSPFTLQGTTNQISIANGNAASGSPTISIVSNPILPGNGGVQVPSGSTLQRLAVNGVVRYNTDTARFEFYEGSSWATIGTGDGTVTSVQGTVNQIAVANSTTTPVVSIAPNPTLPGTNFVQLPIGTTAQRGTPSYGAFRYNTDTGALEVYTNLGWNTVSAGTGVVTFSAGTTGLTPNTPTAGGIVLGGIVNPATGGTGVNNGTNTITVAGNFATSGAYALTLTATGATNVTVPTTGTLATLGGVETLTNKSMSGSANTFTNIPNSALTNNSVTYNGVTVALGASGTITAVNPYALTIGTGLSGTSYNGSAAVTIANTGVLSFSAGTTGLTPNTATTGAITLAGTLAIANGGTGLTATPSNGQIDIGNGTGFTRTTITAGTGITITNGSGSITPSITATGVTAGTYGSSAVIPVIAVNAQGQITSISTQATNAPAYQGTWNANTNSPTLTSSVGTAGYYYVVTTAGNTTLNGVSGWNVGDWAIFSNGAWQKIPGSTTESFTNLITTNLQVGGLTGFVYANNTTGYATAATTAQLLSLLGTTPVANGGTGLTSLTAGSLVYGNGTSAYNTLAIGTSGQILTSTGTAPQWSTLSGVAVTTFSGGTTGLTPSTATSGAITLGGTLVVSNGGTGLTSLTANYIPYGNGTSAFQSSANHTFDGTTLTLGNAGVSARFQGDFSNATFASRTAFVTGTANGSTGIYALPNGTSTAASWQAFNNSNPTNASKILIATNGSTDVQLVSGINGTGTYLPMTFWNNGVEKLRLSVSGGFSVGTTTDAGSTNLLVAGTATALGGIAGGAF